MKKSNNNTTAKKSAVKKSALAEKMLSTNVDEKTASVSASANLEKSAPKKPTNRLDFLTTNAIKSTDIKINDRLLFNDEIHATTKNVDNMFKYALVIAVTKTTIFCIVDSAPYAIEKTRAEKMLFARAEHAKNSVRDFSNIKLTAKYFAQFKTMFNDIMSLDISKTFIEKNALAIASYTKK